MFVYVQPELKIQVFLSGKLVGYIKQNSPNQFYYQPKGSKVKGDYFNTVKEVKQSLENNN